MNNTLINNQCIKEEITREIRIYKNLCDTAKAVLRRKFISLNGYIKSESVSFSVMSNSLQLHGL